MELDVDFLITLEEDCDWDLTGARVSAAKTRIEGTKATADVLRELRQAMFNAGWDGKSATATLASPNEETEGRGIFLRGVTSTAHITVTGVQAAELQSHLPAINPQEAVVVEDGDHGGATVTLRYISSDQGPSDSRRELTDLLRDAGIEMIEGAE
jgi:hypothetical protein